MKRIALLFLVVVGGWSTMGATSCPPPTGPSATPTATATARPAPANTATATSAPAQASATATPTPIYCKWAVEPAFNETRDTSKSLFVNRVRGAMSKYQTEHPDKFDGTFFKFPDSQDVFMQGIIDNLAPRGLDGCIDLNGGDLVVALHTATPLTGISELYHPISSWDQDTGQGRLAQSAPFLGIFTPRGFQ